MKKNTLIQIIVIALISAVAAYFYVESTLTAVWVIFVATFYALHPLLTELVEAWRKEKELPSSSMLLIVHLPVTALLYLRHTIVTGWTVESLIVSAAYLQISFAVGAITLYLSLHFWKERPSAS